MPDKRLRKALIAGGFLTVGDVLTHYPFRYEDRTAFDGWPDGITEAGPALCLQGVITDVQLKRAGPGRPFVVVTLAPPGREDTEGLEGLQAFAAPLTLRWFNMPFIYKSFAAGMEVIAYGKVKRTKQGKLVDLEELGAELLPMLVTVAESFRSLLTRLKPSLRISRKMKEILS